MQQILGLPAADIAANFARMLLYDPDTPLIFSSGLFWVLFLLFIPLYAAFKSSRTKMTVFVAAFSLYFYYKSSGFFFLMLIATSLVDWMLSWAIFRARTRSLRLGLMWLSAGISLSVLGWFKYADFFIANWNAIVRANFQPLELVLPVGISFYTFQSISYVVDVYKRRIAPTRRWLDYLFFLSFFPALVAGPIVRADSFIPQIRRNRQATRPMVWGGMWLVIVGVIKKALVADYIAQFNDLVFSAPELYRGVQSLLGVIGYTMQIYCDFSGYSDMAIGLALIMGFRLGINFDSPYRSRNLTEFWHRWHISLSTWLRDYVYIPLGGNRKGTLRTYVNNFLTMLLGGLWHGAAWKFVFWGAMHGAGLAIHKAARPLLKRIPDNAFTTALSWMLTFSCVALLWVFFRAESFASAIDIIAGIFTDFNPAQLPQFFIARPAWCVMTAAIMLVQFLPGAWADRAQELFIRAPWPLRLLTLLCVVQLVVQFASTGVVPFIYFRF